MLIKMAASKFTAASESMCTPCGRTSHMRTPVKFCLECDEYYCFSCLSYYRKFTSMKDHTIEDVTVSNVEFPCTIELGTPTDNTHPPVVSSIVRLASGSFLVCDCENKALKILDGNYAVVEEMRFTDRPHTACVFNENEVAVSFPDKNEIVFVTLDNELRISSRHPVKTEGECRCMACVNGELYVATGGYENEGTGKVEVYAISGRRNIVTDAGGNRLFEIPNAFAVNPTGSEIHITDLVKGVITINPMGTVLRQLNDPVLQGACGICMDDEGNLFVTGECFQNVAKIEQNGSMKEVLSECDGVVASRSVCFDPEKRCLLVGMEAEKPLVAFKINE